MKDMKDKGYFIVALGLVIAIIVLALNAKAPDVNISSTPGVLAETISVSGTGRITVDPDEAEVYIRIVTEADDAKDAQNENADIAADVRNALKNRGIKDDDMETSSYNLYPKTSYNRETGESEIYGYTVRHTLKITTKDIKGTGDLVDAAVASGANGLDRVSFQLSDELRDEAYNDALEEASAIAKEKAVSIANALSVSLGEITSVSESGVSYTPYRYAVAEKAMAGADEELAPTVISPQDIEVSATVGIAYEIE